jgi:hypothetical protein
MRSRGTFSGGYGAEIIELLREYAVVRLGAVKLLANATDQEHKSALRHAGFKYISSFPPGRAKSRRPYTRWQFEWTRPRTS